MMIFSGLRLYKSKFTLYKQFYACGVRRGLKPSEQHRNEHYVKETITDLRLRYPAELNIQRALLLDNTQERSIISFRLGNWKSFSREKGD